MTGNSRNQPGSTTEYYWTELPKYIAAVEHAVTISHRTADHPADSARQYWASILFTRLCSISISILHLCPGTAVNRDGRHWDFSSLAPLVRNAVRACISLFYLGTEAVDDDESGARVLVMQLSDCTERLHLFQNVRTRAEEIDGFEREAARIRHDLSSNPYFAGLPAPLRESIIKGEIATILTEDQILDRLGVLDADVRGLLTFISSHTDLSPLTFYRTGDKNRGRGEENQVDMHYTAMALDLALDFIIRADADMQALFREALAVRPQEHEAIGGERFANAFQHIRRQQGGHIDEVAAGDDSGVPLLCSNCFHDEGLRLSSEWIGHRDRSKCPNCDSQTGMKLNRRLIAALVQQFFVSGTIQRLEYGGFPAVQFNKHQSTSLEVAPWLKSDLRLIEDSLKVGFFSYQPRLWMVGEVEPLLALRKAGSRQAIISRILNEYPERIFNTDESFYRLRKAPARPSKFEEYDSPPEGTSGCGRFDTIELPILYGSQDLEVCLHECRVASEDELYVATLVPQRALRLLDLAEVLSEEKTTEFESLDMALHMLFLAGRHSYEISREISRAAYEHGFDGLVYPSYFSLLRTGAVPFETTLGISHRRFPGFREHARMTTISNLALFGRPLANGSVVVRCIDRAILNKVEYKVRFGPLFVNESISNAAALRNHYEMKFLKVLSENGLEPK
jgi:hypothetical protein